MNPPLPALDVDLLIEHQGHRVEVKGSGRHLVATFPTLFSLWHFSRAFWPVRNYVPLDLDFKVEWRSFRWSV